MANQDFEKAYSKVLELVGNFHASVARYSSSLYQEAEVRKDFIDKFFCALGWDVNHDQQTNPYEQEVKVEPAVSAAGQRRADYAFHLSPDYRTVRFFVEAKKPYGELGTSDNYFQTIRYAWNSETPLAVLTNFSSLHILDCRYRPDIANALSRLVAKYHYTDYSNRDKFAEIYWLFSREAVADGSIEKRSRELPRVRGRATQRGLLPSGYQNIDESFLGELDQFRTALARSFKAKNESLDGPTLTEIVQRTLDRLVFMRFLEDKGIEPRKIVANFGERGTSWSDFLAASKRLDAVYNGIVFKTHRVLDGPGFQVDDGVFSDICKSLSRSDSPYDFDAIPIHILGSIYERFLGNVIVATAKRARVEPKPEVRKAGGVYYTPEYVVSYIVESTIGSVIAGKTPAEISLLRFADIACGSGSFLLGVFEKLLTHHGQWYNENPSRAKKGECVVHEGKLYLSLNKKREILVNNIFGVDSDSQAVEVCQLSLYLRLLKDETPGSTHQHLLEFAHDAKMKKLLPDLSRNIVCGNSLVSTDILSDSLFASDEEREINPIDLNRFFATSRGKTSFDAIVGNPPYRMLQPHNTSARLLAYLKRSYPAVEFKIDLFHLFLQRASSLIAKGGRLGYIVPTTLLNNVYAQKLRESLTNELAIEQIAVARGRIFPDADVHTSVLVFRKEDQLEIRKRNEVLTTEQFGPDFARKGRSYSRTPQRAFAELPGSVWNILVNETNSSLLTRLTQSTSQLASIAKINRGLITGDRARYFSNSRDTDRHVPILTGSDVHRYRIDEPAEFVLFERPTSAGGCWDESVHFAKHKLVVRQIAECPTASFLDAPVAVTGNIFTVIAGDRHLEKYLLGIINSSLISFFWKIMFHDFKNSFPQVTIFSLGQIPIRRPQEVASAERSKLIANVDEMQRITKAFERSTTDKDRLYYERRFTVLDREIDQLVFDMYEIDSADAELVSKGGDSRIDP